MRDGEWILDTDGAHFVRAVAPEAPETAPAAPVVMVEAPAVAHAGHGAPRGPRGARIGSEDMPVPTGYIRLDDVPWIVRAPHGAP